MLKGSSELRTSNSSSILCSRRRVICLERFSRQLDSLLIFVFTKSNSGELWEGGQHNSEPSTQSIIAGDLWSDKDSIDNSIRECDELNIELPLKLSSFNEAEGISDVRWSVGGEHWQEKLLLKFSCHSWVYEMANFEAEYGRLESAGQLWSLWWRQLYRTKSHYPSDWSGGMAVRSSSLRKLNFLITKNMKCSP